MLKPGAQLFVRKMFTLNEMSPERHVFEQLVPSRWRCLVKCRGSATIAVGLWVVAWLPSGPSLSFCFLICGDVNKVPPPWTKPVMNPLRGLLEFG